MSLTKQAKTLNGRQTAHLQAFLQQTRYPERNQVILLLSVKAGLRAKEIAGLTWDMLTDAEGNFASTIHLRNEATKGSSGRVIPMNRRLREALEALFKVRGTSPYVITSERSQKTSAAVIVNLFAHWYRVLGFRGCSSHSGRRTFITTAAERYRRSGGSLRDVQILAGHAALSTTQRYMRRTWRRSGRCVDLI